jgi:hypothetical protein
MRSNDETRMRNDEGGGFNWLRAGVLQVISVEHEMFGEPQSRTDADHRYEADFEALDGNEGGDGQNGHEEV